MVAPEPPELQQAPGSMAKRDGRRVRRKAWVERLRGTTAGSDVCSGIQVAMPPWSWGAHCVVLADAALQVASQYGYADGRGHGEQWTTTFAVSWLGGKPNVSC